MSGEKRVGIGMLGRPARDRPAAGCLPSDGSAGVPKSIDSVSSAMPGMSPRLLAPSVGFHPPPNEPMKLRVDESSPPACLSPLSTEPVVFVDGVVLT